MSETKTSPPIQYNIDNYSTTAYAWQPDDKVNSPDHYTSGGIETIDFIEAKGLGYHLGNVVKYISRAGKKHSRVLEDLRKARWYLDREISRLERVDGA